MSIYASQTPSYLCIYFICYAISHIRTLLLDLFSYERPPCDVIFVIMCRDSESAENYVNSHLTLTKRLK